MEQTKVTEPTGPTQRKPKSHWIILLTIAVLALNTLACWDYACWLIGCSYCWWWPLDQIADSTGQYAASSGGVHVWHEVGVTGVFTPTGGGQAGFKLEGFDTDAIAVSDWEAMFDEVVEKGYLAIRAPHAPPTYTASTIVSPTVEFSYYSPPATTTKTTVSITVTRRTEYEPAVNAQYPITDGKSHWEVWWIPDGAEPPIPAEPFRLEGDEWPPPGAVEYGIDLVDADALACAGCPLEFLFYNGYVFMGPFRTTIRFHGDVPGNPLVAFDVCYGVSEPTIMQGITPTVPFTHEHCLMNLDTTTRTYTLEWFSSENWDYTFYTQANEAGSVPVPLVGNQVTLGPSDWPATDDEVRILAVLTPTITVSDTMRETFFITATSVVSPDVQAVVYSFALAPSYQLDEGGAPITADLSIGKVASSPVVTAGKQITYTITITNDGPTTPVTAMVVDTFSDSVALAGVTSDGDCAWTSGSAVVACTVANIANGTPAPLNLVVTTIGIYSGTLSNTAVVTPTGDVTDTNVSNNNTGPVQVTVRGKELGYHIYLPVVLRNF